MFSQIFFLILNYRCCCLKGWLSRLNEHGKVSAGFEVTHISAYFKTSVDLSNRYTTNEFYVHVYFVLLSG